MHMQPGHLPRYAGNRVVKREGLLMVRTLAGSEQRRVLEHARPRCCPLGPHAVKGRWVRMDTRRISRDTSAVVSEAAMVAASHSAAIDDLKVVVHSLIAHASAPAVRQRLVRTKRLVCCYKACDDAAASTWLSRSCGAVRELYRDAVINRCDACDEFPWPGVHKLQTCRDLHTKCGTPPWHRRSGHPAGTELSTSKCHA